MWWTIVVMVMLFSPLSAERGDLSARTTVICNLTQCQVCCTKNTTLRNNAVLSFYEVPLS